MTHRPYLKCFQSKSHRSDLISKWWCEICIEITHRHQQQGTKPAHPDTLPLLSPYHTITTTKTSVLYIFL